MSLFFNNLISASKLENKKFLSAIFKWQLETDNLLNEAIHKYDTNGYANIALSLDIGFPNNVARAAGGFLTGSYINWNCETPFIPIDTTVNVCSSTIVKLKDRLTNLSKEEFQKRINLMQFDVGNYNWNFDSGNHFIIIGDDGISSYLLMHSSASEYKKQLDIGLYPVKNNWYWDSIKVYKSDSRYLRYITGTVAENFLLIADKLPEFNKKRHLFFANKFVEGLTEIVDFDTYPHYGMPNRQSVNIGCFVVESDVVVPVFSRAGKNIFLYRVSKNDPELNGKKIIPHGWGKTLQGLKQIRLSEDHDILFLENNSYLISSADKIHGQIRDFSDNPNSDDFYFKKATSYLKGTCLKSIKQLLSYSNYGIKDWRNYE